MPATSPPHHLNWTASTKPHVTVVRKHLVGTHTVCYPGSRSHGGAVALSVDMPMSRPMHERRLFFGEDRAGRFNRHWLRAGRRLSSGLQVPLFPPRVHPRNVQAVSNASGAERVRCPVASRLLWRAGPFTGLGSHRPVRIISDHAMMRRYLPPNLEPYSATVRVREGGNASVSMYRTAG